MLKMLYYPGCSVKNVAKRYEKASLTLLRSFGIEPIELYRWNCCGVVYNLATDTQFYLVAPTRNLIRAQEMSKEVGSNELLVICPMCYNVLCNAELRLRNDRIAYERITKFMDDEEPYEFKIKIRHLLQVLSENIGIEKISKRVKKDMSKAKIATFYGCLLLRPKEVAIDDPEDPQIIENLVLNVGCDAVDHPYRNECCGSYNVVREPEAVWNRICEIVSSMINSGANMIVATCPLCVFNLEEGQKRRRHELKGKFLPVFYVSEVLCYALGLFDGLEPSVYESLKRVLG